MLCLATGLIWSSQERITVYADGEVVLVQGRFDQVGDALDAAGVQPRPEDLVLPGPTATAESGMAIRVESARPVRVSDDGAVRTHWTLQTTLDAFLAEAGIELERRDRLVVDGQALKLANLDTAGVPAALSIEREALTSVTILDGEDSHSITTQAATVGQALQEAGVSIYASDTVTPQLSAWLRPLTTITVQHAIPVTIQADGRLIHTRTSQRRVLDVLAAAGVGLVGKDYTVPEATAELEPGAMIRVVRVTEDFRVEDEQTPYESYWQPSDQFEIDQSGMVSAGAPGIYRRRYRVRYEDGVQVSETLDGEWVAQPPTPQVMGYGTRIVIRTLQTAHGAFEYWRMVRMRVTAYTAATSGKPPDHPAYGITASGLPAGTGIVAVDPDVVPFRSWVYVPGYGRGFAGDTGGGVIGRWIDLGYDEGALQAWNGYVDVYYLTPVPPADRINYRLPTYLP